MELKESSSKIFDEIYKNPMRNLNNVTRYSGLFCMKPETDGYHTIDMMAMCMKMSDIIESDQDPIYGIKIDRRDLIYRCYLHDMDESLMGDISRNIKYYNDDIYNSITNVVNILINENFSEDIAMDINSSKDVDNINGLMVKIADTLQSSIKIYEECKLGNFHFIKILKENIGFVNKLKSVISSSKLNSSSIYVKKALSSLYNIIDSFEVKLTEGISELTVK